MIDKRTPAEQTAPVSQKPPSDQNQVRQRHQLGEPAKQDSVPIPKAP